MAFENIELLTLMISAILFIFISFLYWKYKKGKGEKLLINSIFFICFFVFLNRIFTNIENLFYGDLFNLLEHLSILSASAILLNLTVKYRRKI